MYMANNIMLLQVVLILLYHNYVVAEDGDIRSSKDQLYLLTTTS